MSPWTWGHDRNLTQITTWGMKEIERMGEVLEGDLTGLTFQAIWVYYLCWDKMAPKSLFSTFLFIYLRLREQGRGGGQDLKHSIGQWCHLPGFLGITILVAGSACQPWLTTPLGKKKKKTQEVSPPAAVKSFERDINFSPPVDAFVPLTASSTEYPTKAAKSSAVMDVYAWATRLYARCRVLSVNTKNVVIFASCVCLWIEKGS